MDFSYDLLKIFKTVAFYSSISKAANELCVTQPSVTKSIKKLESKLNITLFVREKKGMVLTDAGKALYRYIIDSINTLDNVELIAQGIKENDVGKIRIGAGESVTKNYLLKTIIEFKKLYPSVTVELINSGNEQMYNDLRYGKLDIIFINSTIIVNKNKYEVFKFMDIEDCFFTTKEMYEDLKNITNIKSILSHSLIVQNENHDTRSFLNAICIKNNIHLKTNIVVDRHSLIEEFVKAGLGIGFATKEYIQKYLDSKEFMILDTNINIEKRYINCVYRNNKNAKLNKFISLLKYNMNNN